MMNKLWLILANFSMIVAIVQSHNTSVYTVPDEMTKYVYFDICFNNQATKQTLIERNITEQTTTKQTPTEQETVEQTTTKQTIIEHNTEEQTSKEQVPAEQQIVEQTTKKKTPAKQKTTKKTTSTPFVNTTKKSNRRANRKEGGRREKINPNSSIISKPKQSGKRGNATRRASKTPKDKQGKDKS
ncbi:hypothetical protein MN116_000134 [Schistosoma mekongi]|uniref:Uncharacterized protein n=1 Tax=Schistosoma mekongi TaxID=38744 RepID=A0AAE1Z7I2_SCHME|nr:hypothetical protein MN116_000134 [Schistosoma mekongi]